MFPFVCKAYTVDQYGDLTTYLKTLEYNHLFVPKFIVVHNTAPPTLKDYANWQKPTPKHGPVSDEQWAHTLEGFYKKKWSGGPHFAATPKGCVVLNPPNYAGVHTPSWNKISWGVETVGDFETDEFGPPISVALVKLLAILHEVAGLTPKPYTLGTRGLHFHKEDKATTHKTCPGSNMVKSSLVAGVVQEMPKQDPWVASLADIGMEETVA